MITPTNPPFFNTLPTNSSSVEIGFFIALLVIISLIGVGFFILHFGVPIAEERLVENVIRN